MAAGEKFKYARVDSEEQSRELRRAVDLLEKAQMIENFNKTSCIFRQLF
jgi:predicted site-specific integrase-resolvase